MDDQTTKMKKTKKKFKLRARTLFLTYPRCGASPAKVLENLWSALDPEWAVVCRERHGQNEREGAEWTTELHIHVVARLKERRQWSNAECFDSFTGQAGNYQAVQNTTKVTLYVTKGNDFVARGIDVDEFKRAASMKKARVDATGWRVASLLEEGGSIEDARKLDKGFFLHNDRKIRRFFSHMKRIQERAVKKLQWENIPEEYGMFAEEVELIQWLNLNMASISNGQKRAIKEEQLWLCGPTNCGKTSLIDWLRNFARPYDVPRYVYSYCLFYILGRNTNWTFYREKWDDNYADASVDLAYLDEFKGYKTLQWMNTFLEGVIMNMLRRGCAPTKKTKNIPVIVLSNHLPKNVYQKVDESALEALEGRLKIVEIPYGECITFYNFMSTPCRDYPKEEWTEGCKKRKRESEVNIVVGAVIEGPFFNPDTGVFLEDEDVEMPDQEKGGVADLHGPPLTKSWKESQRTTRQRNLEDTYDLIRKNDM